MVELTKEKCPYFPTPKQVVFFDNEGTEDMDNPQYIPGIAYRDEIICGCCGGIFPIEEVWAVGLANHVQPIHVYEDWMSLNEVINGDIDLEALIVEPSAYSIPITKFIPQDNDAE